MRFGWPAMGDGSGQTDAMLGKIGVWRHIVVEDRADMPGGREHGDDDVSIPDRFGGRGSSGTTTFDRVAHRLGDEVEGADLMPRLGEVRGHPAAHVAKADECDACHYYPRIRFRIAPNKFPRSEKGTEITAR